MTQKKYTAYKPSGVEWIGEIPEHWLQVPLKRISKLVNGATPSSGEQSYWEGDILWATPEDISKIEGKVLNATKRTLTERGYESCGTTLSPVGSTILTTRAPIGNLALAGAQMCTNQGCKTIVPYIETVDSTFLYYLICAGVPTLQSLGKGTTFMELGNTALGDFNISLPPLPEQQVIASYLDKKTALIDSTIQQKERLIELLQEERTAIINQAVTRGLDPSVKMKDSSVEWLGQVPEHWTIKQVKYVLDNYDYKRIPLSSDDRGKMNVRKYDYYGASGVIDKVENFLFEGEYILIGEDGANLLTRSTALAFKATGKFWVNNHAHILKPKEGSLDFYVELLECIDYFTWVSGSAQPKLTAENLGNIRLPVPPLFEQKSIADFILTTKAEIEKVISKIKSEIRLLDEYRSAMINEVVTGKRCVLDESVSELLP